MGTQHSVSSTWLSSERELWFQWGCLAAHLLSRGCFRKRLRKLCRHGHHIPRFCSLTILCSPDPSSQAPCLSVPSRLCPAPAPATLDLLSGIPPLPRTAAGSPAPPTCTFPSLVPLCFVSLPFHPGARASWFPRAWKCLICTVLVLLVEEVPPFPGPSAGDILTQSCARPLYVTRFSFPEAFSGPLIRAADTPWASGAQGTLPAFFPWPSEDGLSGCPISQAPRSWTQDDLRPVL